MEIDPVDPPSRKRKKSVSLSETEIKQAFFRRKKTRLLIKNRILRILFRDEIHSIEWTLGTTSDELDDKIRKTCGLLPKNSQAYDLYNEQNHVVPFDNERFPDDFNLELHLWRVPKSGYTMEETVVWKNISNKVTQSVKCLTTSLSEIIAEYAHPSIYFVGSRVEMRCMTDGKWWISTIVSKTGGFVTVKVNGWTSNYNQLHDIPITFTHNLNEIKLNSYGKGPLLPLGSILGQLGELVQRRFLKPWQCVSCNHWNASHLIKCETEECTSLRPFYEPCWCSEKKESKSTCVNCQWTCSKCSFVNEPYCVDCENCFQYQEKKGCLNTCFMHLAKGTTYDGHSLLI